MAFSTDIAPGHLAIETDDNDWHDNVLWGPPNYDHLTAGGVVYVTCVKESTGASAGWAKSVLLYGNDGALDVVNLIDLVSPSKPLSLTLCDVNLSTDESGNLIVSVKGLSGIDLKWGVTYDLPHVFGPEA